MKPHFELRAAEMRARNTEGLRAALWADLQKKVTSGKLTLGEEMQIKREFWEARAADELKVREHRRWRNHEPNEGQRVRRKSGKRSSKA